jgi:hypothetical protein
VEPDVLPPIELEPSDGLADVMIGQETDGACSGKFAGQMENMVSEQCVQDDGEEHPAELEGMWVRAWIWVPTESVEEEES